MPKKISSCAIFVLVMALLSTAHAATVDVRVHGDRMDARLENAPLRAALADIGRKARIKVFVQKGLDGTVSASVRNATLEDGIKRILERYSSSMVFAKVDDGSAGGRMVVTEIKVFRKGDATADGIDDFDVLDDTSPAGGPAVSSVPADAGSPAGTHRRYRGSSATGGMAGAGQQQLAPAEMFQNERFAIQRLQKEINALRQSLSTVEEGREEAKTRTMIAAKSAELREREMLLKRRAQGLARMQRQMSLQQ